MFHFQNVFQIFVFKFFLVPFLPNGLYPLLYICKHFKISFILTYYFQFQKCNSSFELYLPNFAMICLVQFINFYGYHWIWTNTHVHALARITEPHGRYEFRLSTLPSTARPREMATSHRMHCYFYKQVFFLFLM